MDQEALMYFQSKSTEELNELVEKHNTQIYKEEAFEIMKRILEDRNKELERHIPGYTGEKRDVKEQHPEEKNEKNIIPHLNNIDNNDSPPSNEEYNVRYIPINETKGGFLKKLANGDFGLVKTYWLFGVVVGMAVNILYMFIEEPLLLIAVYILHIVYITFAFRGIWNAANKYKGNVTWAILAKIAVVLGIITIIGSLITVTYVF